MLRNTKSPKGSKRAVRASSATPATPAQAVEIPSPVQGARPAPLAPPPAEDAQHPADGPSAPSTPAEQAPPSPHDTHRAEQARRAAEVASIERVHLDGGSTSEAQLAGLLLAGFTAYPEGDDPPLDVFLGARNDVGAIEALLEAITDGGDLVNLSLVAAALRPMVTGIRRRLDVGISLYCRTYHQLQARPRVAAPEAGR